MPNVKRKPPGAAVVSLSREGAEWFRDGAEPLHGRASVVGDGVPALVAAIDAAREDAGGRLGAIVLALGGGLIANELIRVPPLPRRELGDVLARRAGKALDARREEVAFTALSAAERSAPGRDKEECWTVAAVRRAELTALCLRLRERRMPVRRVVSARLASLAAARRALADPERPAVLVRIEPAAIALSLCRGDAVLNQDVIEGDFESNPAMASSLIHQIKSISGYWKKESRGEHVEQIVLFGLLPERALLLKLAIEGALLGVTVVCAPADATSEVDGRLAHLRAVPLTGPFNPDLSMPLPPRRATVAAGIAAAALAIVGGGFAAAERTSAEIRALDAEASQLTLSAESLPELRRSNARAAAALASIAARTERLRAIRARGIPVQELFTDVLAALHGRADLGDFDLRSDHRGVARAVISGSVGADPANALASLSEVLRSLERSGRLLDLRLALPADLPGERMSFQIQGTVRSAPASSPAGGGDRG